MRVHVSGFGIIIRNDKKRVHITYNCISNFPINPKVITYNYNLNFPINPKVT